jgi:hypothetical protein
MKYTFCSTKKLTTLIRARNFSLDSLKESQAQSLAEKWLARVQDTLFLQGPAKVVVELSKEDDGYVADVDVSLKYHSFAGHGKSGNPLPALMQAYENLHTNKDDKDRKKNDAPIDKVPLHEAELGGHHDAA